MAMVIATNMGSITAQRHLSNTQNDLNTAMERLSSGNRINSAMDDAAGLQIRDRMDSQINGLTQAVRNSNDAISLAQTAEGALEETTEILQRMRELAVQATNDTYTSADRASLQAEVDQLANELDNISEYTRFNDQQLLDGGFSSKNFQIGANQGETIGLSISSMASHSIGVSAQSGANGDISGQTGITEVHAAKDAEASGTILNVSAATVVEGTDAVAATQDKDWTDSFNITNAGAAGVAANDTIAFKTSEGTATYTVTAADVTAIAAKTGAEKEEYLANQVASNLALAGYSFEVDADDATQVNVTRTSAGAFDEEGTAIVTDDPGGTPVDKSGTWATDNTHTEGTVQADAVPATAWNASQTMASGASKGDSVTFKIHQNDGNPSATPPVAHTTVEDFVYTADRDIGSAVDLANDIASKLNGQYAGYTVSAANGEITIQSLTGGDTNGHTLETTVSQYAGQAEVAQESYFKVGTASTGAVQGDKMTITINGDSWTYETDATAPGTGTALASDIKADWDTAAATGGWQSNYTLSVTNDEVHITAKNKGTDGAFTASISYDANASHAATVSVRNIATSGTGVAGNTSSGSASLETNAAEAIRILDEAIQQVGEQRSSLGAFQNRLEHNISNVQSTIENTSAARSRIEDADFATESANLAKAQVLQQAGTAMLAQANASTQNVMSLLR